MQLHAHNIVKISITNRDFNTDGRPFRIIEITATDKNGTAITIDLFGDPGLMPDINLSQDPL